MQLASKEWLALETDLSPKLSECLGTFVSCRETRTPRVAPVSSLFATTKTTHEQMFVRVCVNKLVQWVLKDRRLQLS